MEHINTSKIQYHRTIWIIFLSLFFIVMIVPTLIVYRAGNTVSFKGLLNETNQNQNSSKSQNGLDSSARSSITMGWVAGNSLSPQLLGDYKNLNVVSPVVASIDSQYNLQVPSTDIKTIQTTGKMVWGRIVMDTDTKTNVHGLLANSNKVRNLIQQIYQSALKNNWNGINLDVENVSSSDRTFFSQFLKNLSNELNKTSIVLTIDLPPDPGGINNNQSPYDHKEIGKYCNYVIFMGYDQHWSTDPVPGPVTSLSWLKQNIQEFIQTGISPDKIILGLPAYTRIWEQNQQGNIVNDPAEPISYVENLVQQNHRNLSWDSALGEYYTSYYVNNLQYKIWLPTEKSYNLYLNLISQYRLAGSAVWNLNLMNTDYWNKIY